MNRIIKYLLCATLFLVAAMPAMAERYSWEGVSFDAPAEGYVNFCSPTRLEIIWEDVMLVVEQMMPVKESEDTFFSYLVRRARGFNMYDIEKTKIKVKGFKTYSIDGTLPDGSRAIISDLSAKKEKIRLTITVN